MRDQHQHGNDAENRPHQDRANGDKTDGRRLRITHILRQLSEGDPADPITVEDISRRLGDRAFGILLLIFSLPNCLPLPGIPGLSFVTSLPVVFFAAQLAWGLPAPYVPRWLLNKNLKKGHLAKITTMSERYLHWIERGLKPRLIGVVSGLPERLLGVVALALALLLSLPVPLGNMLPALALAVLSLAIAERDGALALIGYVLSVFAVAWLGFLLWGGKTLLDKILSLL